MKKEYNKPKLEKHGKLEQQTQAGGVGNADSANIAGSS